MADTAEAPERTVPRMPAPPTAVAKPKRSHTKKTAPAVEAKKSRKRRVMKRRYKRRGGDEVLEFLKFAAKLRKTVLKEKK